MEKLSELFQQFSSLKIGVIGDVMIDHYLWGRVDRISPEAPVPVVSLEREESRIGGAANVALNLRALDIQTFLISMTGDDPDGKELQQLCHNEGINTTYLCSSSARRTTRKTRVISRNQHMFRLDAEMTTDLSSNEQQILLQKFEAFISKEKPALIILEDYNKGVLTRELIGGIIKRCQDAGILTSVDPKQKNFFEYRGVDVFKPNQKEIHEALQFHAHESSLSVLRTIHKELQNRLQHKVSFITLSEKGVFYEDAATSAIIPSHLRNIADVSGAGDTVIAVGSAVYALTQNACLMAEIANIAGGLVCEIVGTAAIHKETLLHECELLLS